MARNEMRPHFARQAVQGEAFPRRGLVLWPQLLYQGLVLLHQRRHHGLRWQEKLVSEEAADGCHASPAN